MIVRVEKVELHFGLSTYHKQADVYISWCSAIVSEDPTTATFYICLETLITSYNPSKTISQGYNNSHYIKNVKYLNYSN